MADLKRSAKTMILDSAASLLASITNSDSPAAVWAQFEATLSFFEDRGWLDEKTIARYRSSRDDFVLRGEDFRIDVREAVVEAYPRWKAQIRSLPAPFSTSDCLRAWKQVLEVA